MLPTTASVSEQRDALFRRVGEMVEAAGRSGVNVLCLQEAWSEFALYEYLVISLQHGNEYPLGIPKLSFYPVS